MINRNKHSQNKQHFRKSLFSINSEINDFPPLLSIPKSNKQQDKTNINTKKADSISSILLEKVDK